MAYLPENIRQGDGEGDKAAQPNPFLAKMASFGCEQQCD